MGCQSPGRSHRHWRPGRTWARGLLRSWTKRRDCWTCCPLGSETEVTQGHTPAATGEKSSRNTGNGSAKQPHRRWSSFEPQQTKLRAQLLLQLQRHLQAHLPLRKKLLWLFVQRFLSHHNHAEMQSLTWEETRGNYRENLTFNSGYDSQDSKLS